ncbi:amidohydrolase family protein [Nocardioides bizhenqiangii]|uniref:Amidohydrolase family protein n=1 Tax=Nocardioides bizhenqiangii TaxID=3095076 RepID=A0ABZ0ZL03_9ACTN|nr:MULTISPECIES: amidohydrolase family protein [unclassified Nocardioides]MDZ5620680.1 amidohydrolase family protein [Nocardioides sp. HM23]WQQ25046.1 amidohydrolase family protein [Nocardioides sp. HM61]
MLALRASHAFDGARFLEGGATVLVEGERIVGVEPVGFPVPDGCEVSSSRGTLLPGLVDAHAHLVSDAQPGSLERVGTMTPEEIDGEIERSLAAQAAHGVTTVRDLGDRDYRTLGFRDRRVPGQARIVAAGPPITIPGGHCHYLGCVAATPEELRQAVADHDERGVDVIKVMASGGFLTPGTDMFGAQYEVDVLRSLVEAAHDRSLQVLAHAHSVAGIEHAVAAGVDGIEHFTGFCEQGSVLSDDLLDRVAAAGILVDPTMGNDFSLVGQLPPPPPQVADLIERLGLDIMAFFAQRYVDVGRMRDHGVSVVPGVDSGAMPLKAHGNAWIAVTDLVRCGYPVDEALAAGTSGAADACGVGDVTGRLAAGYDADLLVVDGDIESDPAALGRPQTVVIRGRHV